MKQFISHQGRQMLRDHVFGSVDPHDSLNILTLSKYIGLHGTNNVIHTSGMNTIAPRTKVKRSSFQWMVKREDSEPKLFVRS